MERVFGILLFLIIQTCLGQTKSVFIIDEIIIKDSTQFKQEKDFKKNISHFLKMMHTQLERPVQVNSVGLFILRINGQVSNTFVKLLAR